MRDHEFVDTGPAVAAFADLRARRPLVQCITNFVAMTSAANAVLAAGGAPAMIHCAEEAGDFAKVAGALTVNIGTLSPAWVEGIRAAIAGAKSVGTPWVFDPVGHFATPYRSRIAREILGQNPTILRGNASEILAFGEGASAGRGVDSGDPVCAAIATARDLSKRSGTVVAVTGAQDFLTDGDQSVMISGGSVYMEQVTAMGCSLTAVMGGFAAVAEDPFVGALGALLLFAAAGAVAAGTANGPGSFAVAFVDALARVTPDDLANVPVSSA